MMACGESPSMLNINNEKVAVVVPWHDPEQIARFLDAWQLPISEMKAVSLDWLVLQHDATAAGCAATKNRGVAEAMRRGADIVVVLDDDCYPENPGMDLGMLARDHAEALQPQPLQMLLPVTDPPSRGTPFRDYTVKVPVAASMGFWLGIGDYCAVRQLVHGEGQLPDMTFKRDMIFGRYFSLCGMNLAFRPKDWMPWCQFIDVPRFDDIWMGWLWQKEAYRRGYGFNLNGPLVRHVRQSNLWRNLELEAKHLAANETLWREIALASATDYPTLRGLLPC